MKEEEKQLLIKDLCSRLPYGTIIQVNDWTLLDTELKVGHISQLMNEDLKFKPYLRPMSSMTKDEILELKWLNEKCDAMPTFEYVSIENYRIYDWMNRHHFDYRGLIEKGLAIEVTKENNPYKE